MRTEQPTVAELNRILAATMSLRDLYRARVARESELDMLFDEHAREQAALVDALQTRIAILGGVAGGPSEPVPAGGDHVAAHLARLLATHEHVVATARRFADDLLMTDVVQTNQAEAWFISEHLLVDEQLSG